MKRTFVILFVVVSIAILVIGCGGDEISSQEEAAYFAYSQPDFKEILSIESVYGSIYSFCKESSEKPENFCIPTKGEVPRMLGRVLHIVRYKDRNDNIITVYLNEERPPKIIEKLNPK